MARSSNGFEVLSLFTMADDIHSKVGKFTIKEGIPVDQISCNYVSNLIVLKHKGRGDWTEDRKKFLEKDPGKNYP
jgi:hypothetical protein